MKKELFVVGIVGGLISLVFWRVAFEIAKLIFDNVEIWQLLFGYVVGMVVFLLIEIITDTVI